MISLALVSATPVGPNWGVFPLFVLAYALTNFVVRGGWLAEAKPKGRSAWLRHIQLVALIHALCLLPVLWSLGGAILLVGLIALHVILDMLRVGLDRATGGDRLWVVFVDLGLHLVLLWFAARQFPADAWPLFELDRRLGQRLPWIAAIFAFNVHGASAIVRSTLRPWRAAQAPTDDDELPGAGHRIGILERWILLGLVASNQWGAVGLVLTAKSIARFKKMDDQRFAEVYLLGTMTSVLIAMASGGLMSLVLDSRLW